MTLSISSVGLWVSVIGLLITVVSLTSGAVSVLVRMAIAPVKMDVQNIKASQNERKATVLDLYSHVNERVKKVECVEDKTQCGKARDEYLKLLSSQLTQLNNTLNCQDEKRQKALEENNEMFTDIRIRITKLASEMNSLSVTVIDMKRIIHDRSEKFRTGNGYKGHGGEECDY